MTAAIDLQLGSSKEASKRRGQLTVRRPTPDQVEVYEVQFTSNSWLRATVLAHREPAVPPPSAARPPQSWQASTQPSRTTGVAFPARTRQPAPGGRRRPDPPTRSEEHESKAVEPPGARSTAPAMRAEDGKRNVWLWSRDGEVYASLFPVGQAKQHRLDPSEVARLLLADPARTMPAIRSLTGIVEDEQAVERMRTWLRGVVHLNAAVPAGRTMLRAPYQPAGSSRDRSIRIVSGGLPGLGKRRG